ncbi:MAG: DUF2203 family protein, partial [Chloroflexota bacterium]
MAPRLFSRDEAESLLPQIAPLLWKARDLKKQHDESQADIIALQNQAKGNGHGIDTDLARSRSSLEQAAVAINEIIERITKLGIEVK